MSVRFEHVPGYSGVDHLVNDLLSYIDDEMRGRPQTKRSAEFAIRRANRRFVLNWHTYPPRIDIKVERRGR